MTDPSPTLAPAEERGTLDVRTRALQHIVETAARRVPGTAAHRSALGRLGLGGAVYPRADVRLFDGGARVVLDVACVWPCPVSDVATRVRDEVLAEATRLSGVALRDVDVVVHLVDADLDDESRGRVR